MGVVQSIEPVVPAVSPKHTIKACPPLSEAGATHTLTTLLDFVLYDCTDAKVVAAVELDDRSHDRRDRRERDEFVEPCAG